MKTSEDEEHMGGEEEFLLRRTFQDSIKIDEPVQLLGILNILIIRCYLSRN